MRETEVQRGGGDSTYAAPVLGGEYGGVGGGRTKDKEQKMMVSGGLCWSATSLSLGLAVPIGARWAGPGAADSGLALVGTNRTH